MTNGPNVLVTLSEVILTFFVPTVVWAVLVIGLAQLVAGWIHKVRVAPRKFVGERSAQRAG